MTDPNQSHFPKPLGRTEILDKYWLEFVEVQRQEMQRRMKSGMGIPKGLITEDNFWDWAVLNKWEEISNGQAA